jgi:Protein of unknown function DUF47
MSPVLRVDQPPRVSLDLLKEAAQTTVKAAVLVHHLATIDGDDEPRERLRQDVELLEADGDRITHDLHRDVADRRALGHKRGALLALVDTLDEATDRLYDLAEIDPRTVPQTVRVDITAVLRDIARTNAATLAAVDDHSRAARERGTAADPLLEDGYRLVREAHASAMIGPRPLDALRTERWLSAARAALDAGAAARRRIHLFALGL